MSKHIHLCKQNKKRNKQQLENPNVLGDVVTIASRDCFLPEITSLFLLVVLLKALICCMAGVGVFLPRGTSQLE